MGRAIDPRKRSITGATVVDPRETAIAVSEKFAAEARKEARRAAKLRTVWLFASPVQVLRKSFSSADRLIAALRTPKTVMMDSRGREYFFADDGSLRRVDKAIAKIAARQAADDHRRH
jgi:hypothetical protein